MAGDPAAAMRWLWAMVADSQRNSGPPPSRVGDQPDNQPDSTEGGAHGQSDQFRRGRRQVRHALLAQSKVDQVTAVPGAPGLIPSFEVDS
jgi:hypothetical protein